MKSSESNVALRPATAGAKTGVPPWTGLNVSGDENASRRFAASSGDGILFSFSPPLGGGILSSGGGLFNPILTSGEFGSKEIAPPNNEKLFNGAMNGDGSIAVEVEVFDAEYVKKGEVGDGVGKGRYKVGLAASGGAVGR